jgi:protein-S-isoprenylcysteine O-methyltransferase Ste14
VLRHLLSIMLLPFVVVVVVPWRILVNTEAGPPAMGEPWWFALRAAGLVVGLMGFALFAWCVTLFARVGRGTLAPWDPTRALVAVGPYRYVRNPMITGVTLMLLGEAAFWGSKRIGLWAVTFVAINHLYFVLSEEPGLERRFGPAYRSYKARVPRWLPRWPE